MIQTTIKKTRPVEHEHDAKKPKGFSSLAALPSNLGAIEAGMRFANGTTPFLVVLGSTGWGKTHLINSVCAFMRLQGEEANEPVSATVYTDGSDKVDESLPLLLDDVQDVLRNMRTKQQFRRMLERRVRAKRPTMMALSDDVTQKQIAQFLPSAREWGVQTILEPTHTERELIVRQISDVEGVGLSRPIVSLMSRHLFGNGRSIQGALQTLRLIRSDWSRRNDVCEACGVLMPYLHGIEGWDVRDVVMDAIDLTFERRAIKGVCKEYLCAYLLIVEMRLSEQAVATFLGESPSKVYGMSTSIKLQLDDDVLRNCMNQCKDAIVRAIDNGQT